MSCAFQINDFDPAKNDRVDAVSVPMPPDGKGGVFDQPIYWAQLKLIGDGTPYFDPDFNSGLGISNLSLINLRVFNVLGYINVSGENLNAVEVFNISGQKIYHSVITDNVITVPSATFPQGVYLVKVFDNNGASVTRKIIK
jgi:hypothetical protein